MKDGYLNKTYNQTKQDVYNMLDLLKDELKEETNDINWGHVGNLEHVRENLMESYCFVSGKEVEDVNQELADYRQNRTYPGFQNDLESLSGRIAYCQYECDMAAEGGDVSRSLHRECDVKYLTDILNAVNDGNYRSAYENIEGLTPLSADHVPQRLCEFLEQYRSG